jgi:hypothetical protein
MLQCHSVAMPQCDINYHKARSGLQQAQRYRLSSDVAKARQCGHKATTGLTVPLSGQPELSLSKTASLANTVVGINRQGYYLCVRDICLFFPIDM